MYVRSVLQIKWCQEFAVFLHMSVGPGCFHRGKEPALCARPRGIRSESTFAVMCLGKGQAWVCCHRAHHGPKDVRPRSWDASCRSKRQAFPESTSDARLSFTCCKGASRLEIIRGLLICWDSYWLNHFLLQGVRKRHVKHLSIAMHIFQKCIFSRPHDA